MKELMNDIALVDAVTRRFESIGYSMDDAIKVATVAILTGEPILVTNVEKSEWVSPRNLIKNNNNTKNPRFNE
jgi:hypothetical protein